MTEKMTEKDTLARIAGLKGGRGECDLCGEWHSNVAYHREHECRMRKADTEDSAE